MKKFFSSFHSLFCATHYSKSCLTRRLAEKITKTAMSEANTYLLI